MNLLYPSLGENAMKDWIQSIQFSDAYMNFLITLSKSNGYSDLELVLCVTERRDER